MWFKKLALSIVSVIVTLILLEGVLQISSLTSPSIDYLLTRQQQKIIPDEALGYRPNPLFPEHDQKGFRNKSVPIETCLVAMGDSQTYGLHVLPEQAWPQQVEALDNIKTYNMAYGGYGPVESLILWEEALELEPKLVIVALYAGNDLYDAYDIVYNRGQIPSLKSPDENIVKSLMANVETSFDFEQYIAASSLPEEKHGIFRTFLAEYSKLYGVLRAAKRAYLYEYNYAKKDPRFADDWKLIKQQTMANDRYWLFDNGNVRTVFTPDDRLVALDFNELKIMEGRRIALQAIHSMNEQAQTANIAFAVLLLPTKELAFKDAIYEDATEIPETYETLIKNEEQFWQETKQFLTAHQIYFIDAWPILSEAVEAGNQPYPISANSHKNATGHYLVAQLVLSHLEANFASTLESCKEQVNSYQESNKSSR